MAVFRNPQFETIHLKTELKRNFIYLKQNDKWIKDECFFYLKRYMFVTTFKTDQAKFSQIRSHIV